MADQVTLGANSGCGMELIDRINKLRKLDCEANALGDKILDYLEQFVGPLPRPDNPDSSSSSSSVNPFLSPNCPEEKTIYMIDTCLAMDKDILQLIDTISAEALALSERFSQQTDYFHFECEGSSSSSSGSISSSSSSSSSSSQSLSSSSSSSSSSSGTSSGSPSVPAIIFTTTSLGEEDPYGLDFLQFEFDSVKYIPATSSSSSSSSSLAPLYQNIIIKYNSGNNHWEIIDTLDNHIVAYLVDLVGNNPSGNYITVDMSYGGIITVTA